MLRYIIHTLPPLNYQTLQRILLISRFLLIFMEKNNLTVQKIASVLSESLFSPFPKGNYETPKYFGDKKISKVIDLVKGFINKFAVPLTSFMIYHANEIFELKKKDIYYITRPSMPNLEKSVLNLIRNVYAFIIILNHVNLMPDSPRKIQLERLVSLS